MLISLLKSKIHRAVVTGADLDYVGSITIDKKLMVAADLVEFEKVHILDITNGARLETYAISSQRGTGEICINGAAAHLISPNDKIIIISYALLNHAEANTHLPIVVHVNDKNQIID